jgi:uncharacterized protein (TIGR03435 family)
MAVEMPDRVLAETKQAGDSDHGFGTRGGFPCTSCRKHLPKNKGRRLQRVDHRLAAAVKKGRSARHARLQLRANRRNRIEEITVRRIGLEPGAAKKVALAVAGVVVLTAPTIAGILAAPAIHAQSQPGAPDQLRFDAVSIKPNHSDVTWSSGSPIIDKVGRYTAKNVTLKSLITWFYGVRDAQIAAGPRWLDADRYDIDAEADGQPSPEQSLQMLRALLADRFRLQVHFEPRDLSGYALMTPKNGLKFGPHLAKVERPECVTGAPGAPGCRGAFFGPQSLAVEHIDFALLARTLSSMVGLLVTDETQLDGKYDIRLDLPPSETSAAISYGDTIMTALREQTGLRLESRKVPTQVLVIDRAEKPTDN